MLKKLLNWKGIAAITAMLLFALSSMQVLQSPTRLLDDVLVEDKGSVVVLHVKTNLPIRYENHYPEGPSKFIQIKVRAISLSGSDKNEYMGNESILPGFAEQVPIVDVAYEGDVEGGPFISLRFSKAISYQVKEDPELGGLQVIIPKREVF